VRLLIVIILGIVLTSCDNPVAVNVKLNEEFKFKVGQNAELQDEFLRIKFVDVTEESRCPANLRCFIPGNAAVAITIQQNKDIPVNDTLNTYSYPRSGWYLGYKIDLVKLEPYPENTTPIPKLNYVATFIITYVLPD